MVYGHRYLMAVRRQDDLALEQIGEALARDPLSIDALNAMGWVRYHRREYDVAISNIRDSLQLYPEEPWLYVCLGQSLVRKGQYEEGVAEIRKAVEIAPDSGWILAYVAWVYGMSGRVDEAREAFSQLEQQAQRNSISPVALAWALVGMGEKDETINWLEKAYAQRDNLIIWLRVPDFSDLLSAEPRYQALLQDLGLEN
jgi:serine/threonine-protein kinase